MSAYRYVADVSPATIGTFRVGGAISLPTGPAGPPGPGAPVLNVVLFGAVGDGVTNNTVIFQLVLDTLNAAGGGTLFIPRGTFAVGPLTVGSLTTIEGEGLASRLKLVNTSAGAVLSLKTDQVQCVTLRDFMIDGNKANQVAANDGINFINATAAINPTVLPGDGDAHHVITGLYVTQCKGSGLELTGRGASDISDSMFAFCDVDGVTLNGFDNTLTDVICGVLGRYGFGLVGGSSNHNTLHGCKVFLALDDGFRIESCFGNRLTSCVSQANAGSGFHLFAGHSNIIQAATALDNNFTAGPSGTGFRLSTSAANHIVEGAAYNTTGTTPQIAALQLTPSVVDCVINVVSRTSTMVTGDFLSGSFAYGNCVNVNGTRRKHFNAQTGTTYTLVAADTHQHVTLSNASAITLTIPTNATVPFPIGTVIELFQLAAGQVTVAPAGGVTLTGTPGLKLRAINSRARLEKTGTNVWILDGDIAA